MEELIGLIVFTLILRLLGAGRRAAPAQRPAAPPATRQPIPTGDRPPARPTVQPVAGDQVFDLRELLREAFPAAVAPARPAKIRPRRQSEPPPPPAQQPERAAVKAAPVPAERPAASFASPIPGFHDLAEPHAAARAVVLAEIFGPPRCHRAHRPPGTR
ncbi:MAG TPA: hypothetical protein VLK32_08365 [Bacillota bacterium]|nr:hypothetical protein [Bacillota bacterium]